MFKRGEQYTLTVEGAKYFNECQGVWGNVVANEGDKVWVLENSNAPFCVLVKQYTEIPQETTTSTGDMWALGESHLSSEEN